MTHLWPQIPHTGRLIGYARVSTHDQRLDIQINALRAVGCDVVHTDPGVSGRKARRPGLDQALAEIRPGDVLVVFKLDRLGRSVLHLADLLTRFHAQGVHFCSISEGINTTTPGGKLVFHVFSAVAEFQREIICENTLHGLEAARRRGKRLGRPPKLDLGQVAEAYRCIRQCGLAVKDASELFAVSPSTMRRAIHRFDLAA